MSYVIYNKKTTMLVGGTLQYKQFKNASSAKGYMTRKHLSLDEYAIADALNFYETIERKVTRVNLMSGKPFEMRANTPLCCDPSSETYWSM